MSFLPLSLSYATVTIWPKLLRYTSVIINLIDLSYINHLSNARNQKLEHLRYKKAHLYNAGNLWAKILRQRWRVVCSQVARDNFGPGARPWYLTDYFKYFILGQKNDECFPTLLPIIGAIIQNMVWKCFTYLATTSSRVRRGELRGGWATIRVGPGFQFIFNSSTQFCIPLNLLMLHDGPRFQSWLFSYSILLTNFVFY